MVCRFPWKMYQPKIAWLQEYWSSDEGHFYCVTPVLSLSMQPVCISSVTGLFIGQIVCECIAELTLFYCQISRAVSCKSKSSSENTSFYSLSEGPVMSCERSPEVKSAGYFIAAYFMMFIWFNFTFNLVLCLLKIAVLIWINLVCLQEIRVSW